MRAPLGIHFPIRSQVRADWPRLNQSPLVRQPSSESPSEGSDLRGIMNTRQNSSPGSVLTVWFAASKPRCWKKSDNGLQERIRRYPLTFLPETTRGVETVLHAEQQR